MKTLRYDPGDGVRFWEAIRQLPGFPANESMPIKGNGLQIECSVPNNRNPEISWSPTKCPTGHCDG